jgi:hypothetical protein
LSNTFFASLRSACMTGLRTSNFDSASSLPLYGTELPYSVTVSVPWMMVKFVSGMVLVSTNVPPAVATSCTMSHVYVLPFCLPTASAASQNWRKRASGCSAWRSSSDRFSE